jgi:predicted nucleic acid-binding protein
MMVLADTSIWIDHFRNDNAHLRALLLDGTVAVHPFIVGELACGNLKKRDEIISLMITMPQSKRLPDQAVLSFINTRQLYGKGIGWVDAHLLASAVASGMRLHTLDKKLLSLKTRFEIY